MFQLLVVWCVSKFKVKDFLHKDFKNNSLAYTEIIDAYNLLNIANFIEEIWVTVFESTKPGKTSGN